ncbi:Protein of unknown function [Evansella caseinilytica]|uniref:DUF3906 family protein n=1 Tax=Evansella caseinilytica TaxID=1503961 RepID=A0A1H3RYG0_9BACI|nr:DUF3906 family protein [Evansella caseinilytica]SDZ30670.1 Protein of unknown function [Evansella caseinilytica]
MNIYRLEALINGNEYVDLVVIAGGEEAAFQLAEIELEKSYLKTPVIEEITLLEKRKLAAKGGGFVIPRRNG